MVIDIESRKPILREQRATIANAVEKPSQKTRISARQFKRTSAVIVEGPDIWIKIAGNLKRINCDIPKIGNPLKLQVFLKNN